MKSVGVREFHQNTSVYLRLVKAGECVEVTERGKPIAMVTAIPAQESRLERMVREGRATPAKYDLLEYLDSHPPLPAVEGMPTMTEMLMEAREDERY